MIEDKCNHFIELYSSNQEQSTDNKVELFETNIESINNYNHYFCIECHKFPFIKFCKNKKNVRLTCSCFNNKKISIEELFNLISIKNINSTYSSEANKINIKNEVICNEHNTKFKGFSKFFLNNYCEDCAQYKNEIYDNDIIRFDDIKLDKIEELFETINDNNCISDELSEQLSEEISDNIIFNKFNKSTYEKISKNEEKRFKELVNIIINDYKYYPNFTHFFNIRNLLYFFNIENKPIQNEGNINLIEKKEPIIIEYINDGTKKIKLFSKIFVKNNKKNCSVEIEGKRLELIEDYEFKTKEKKVRVKWNTNNVSDVSYLFYGYKYLLSLPDISQWNTNKVKNMKALFYNCKSLTNIPDNFSNKEYIFPPDINPLAYNYTSLLHYMDSQPELEELLLQLYLRRKRHFKSEDEYDQSQKHHFPDISKWITNNVTDISYLFYGCKSLYSLPDISKWNTNKVTKISCLFEGCET